MEESHVFSYRLIVHYPDPPSPVSQCYGSVTFWYGSGSADKFFCLLCTVRRYIYISSYK
jgi:hypothetical protein